jgi:EAL domain-containing protein (putative c-di-GMP-specific phosphodiesterase class I)
VIEITESEFIKNLGQLSYVLNKFRRENLVLAIDDFGAGYAGLNLLAEIQPDLIKIDMSLLRNVDESGPRQAIVRAINNICIDLGIDVLAEGVETEDEFTWLENLGITLYQGYWFAKPAFECLQTKEDLMSNSFLSSLTKV